MHRSLLPASALLSLAACGGGDPALIESGRWTLDEALVDGASLEEELQPVGQLLVDAEADTVTFLDADGAELVQAGFTRRAEDQWPQGCPTQFDQTDMEVADIDLDEVDLGGLVVVAPVLMADCPNGDWLLLFADSGEAASESACTEASACARYQ